jgi:hypothetical protein
MAWAPVGVTGFDSDFHLQGYRNNVMACLGCYFIGMCISSAEILRHCLCATALAFSSLFTGSPFHPSSGQATQSTTTTDT